MTNGRLIDIMVRHRPSPQCCSASVQYTRTDKGAIGRLSVTPDTHGRGVPADELRTERDPAERLGSPYLPQKSSNIHLDTHPRYILTNSHPSFITHHLYREID